MAPPPPCNSSFEELKSNYEKMQELAARSRDNYEACLIATNETKAKLDECSAEVEVAKQELSSCAKLASARNDVEDQLREDLQKCIISSALSTNDSTSNSSICAFKEKLLSCEGNNRALSNRLFDVKEKLDSSMIEARDAKRDLGRSEATISDMERRIKDMSVNVVNCTRRERTLLRQRNVLRVKLDDLEANNTALLSKVCLIFILLSLFLVAIIFSLQKANLEDTLRMMLTTNSANVRPSTPPPPPPSSPVELPNIRLNGDDISSGNWATEYEDEPGMEWFSDTGSADQAALREADNGREVEDWWF